MIEQAALFAAPADPQCRAARNGLRGCSGPVEWSTYFTAHLCRVHELAAADAEAAAEAR